MKCEVVEPKKTFTPVTISLTFESLDEIRGGNGFAERFDICHSACGQSGHTFMSYDHSCQKIREALRKVGY